MFELPVYVLFITFSLFTKELLKGSVFVVALLVTYYYISSKQMLNNVS